MRRPACPPSPGKNRPDLDQAVISTFIAFSRAALPNTS